MGRYLHTCQVGLREASNGPAVLDFLEVQVPLVRGMQCTRSMCVRGTGSEGFNLNSEGLEVASARRKGNKCRGLDAILPNRSFGEATCSSVEIQRDLGTQCF